MRAVLLPCAYGDAADRITILVIKSERMTDPAQLASVRAQLDAQSRVLFADVPRTPEFDALFAALKAVNERLWEIEDDIRDHERAQDFGDGFVRLARAVYTSNDERARIKREIDLLLGSDLREEKSYTSYGGDADQS
jgi:hypothetical protein